MNTFQRIMLSVFIVAMNGVLATSIGNWRFPDDEQMAMLLSCRNLVTAVLFVLIYIALPGRKSS